MPVTQIPSRDPLPPPPDQPEQRDLFEAQHWETAYRSFNPDDVPHLLIQLQDDLSRARKREALWLSVILHLFVIILLWNSEKLMELLPHRTVALAIRTDTGPKDATFLELPPDAQKRLAGLCQLRGQSGRGVSTDGGHAGRRAKARTPAGNTRQQTRDAGGRGQRRQLPRSLARQPFNGHLWFGGGCRRHGFPYQRIPDLCRGQ